MKQITIRALIIALREESLGAKAKGPPEEVSNPSVSRKGTRGSETPQAVARNRRQVAMLIYMDVHVPFAITAGLRLRGVDVLTAQEDGTTELDDDVLLDRVNALGRVIFTRDVDFLAHARERQTIGMAFSGVVYAHQLKASIRQCVVDLELIAKAYEPEDMLNRVEYLPL